MSAAIQINQPQMGPDPSASGTPNAAVTTEQLAAALAAASDPAAALVQLKANAKAGKLDQAAKQNGTTPAAMVAQAAQMAGLDGAEAVTDVPANYADGAAADRPSPAVTGQVGNLTTFDPDYGALKTAYEANNVPVPTEKTVKNLNQQTTGNSAVNDLVSSVKSNLQTGSPLPTVADYSAVQNNNIKLTMKDADGDDLAGIQSPAALVMLVMLRAKNELQQDKRDALGRLQMYSKISDGLNTIMNTTVLPKQQELQGLVAKESESNKQATKSVQLTVATDYDIDSPVGTNGLPASFTTYKDGKPVSDTQQVTQTQMTTIVDSLKNQVQQVQQRISREQTSYSGYDSQDSTLSNIISAVNKTFNDSVQAIGRNIHS